MPERVRAARAGGGHPRTQPGRLGADKTCSSRRTRRLRRRHVKHTVLEPRNQWAKPRRPLRRDLEGGAAAGEELFAEARAEFRVDLGLGHQRAHHVRGRGVEGRGERPGEELAGVGRVAAVIVELVQRGYLPEARSSMTLSEWSRGDLIAPINKRKGQAPSVPTSTSHSAAPLTVGSPAFPARPNVTGRGSGAVLSCREDGVDEPAGLRRSAHRVVRPGGPTAAAPSQSGGGRCHAAPPHGR
ncbi:hypothetical protein GCM10009579_82540 [Streptomyces javensis]|uniref:Uncharacterized protein n=1 Tax=Streptomyces javensis TaxID=114698 RepID=A0ABN1XDX8_9ACTN